MSKAARQTLINLLPLLAGVVVALILITLILTIEGANVGEVWDAMYSGAWSDASTRVRVITFWMPLLLCSSGLLLTFSGGLWNIGIEGQLTMGAVGATMGALFLRFDSLEQQLFAEIGLAAALGAGWGLLTAILKTRGGVNEIFGGVALNFIAALFSSFLISGPWSPPTGGTGSRTAPFEEFTLLPVSSEYPRLSPLMIYIAVSAFVMVALMLVFTRFGLQLKAIGKSEPSARALGIPTERNLWLAMALCGGLAGMAGALRVLHISGRALQANSSGGIGFLALLVVLLVAMRPILVPIISFVFSFLITGALRVESTLRVDSSLVNVMQGILVLAVLLFDGIRQQAEANQQRRAIAAEAAKLADTVEIAETGGSSRTTTEMIVKHER